MFSGRGTPSRQLNWAIEVDIASLSLEPERRDRKFSRQNLEQDDADKQRALRKKSRKVKGKIIKIFKVYCQIDTIFTCPGFSAGRVAGDH